MRIVLVLALALMLVPLPATAAEDDAITLPRSRDGDAARFTAFAAGSERVVSWRGPLETVEDAFGTPRLVYAMDSLSVRPNGWCLCEGDGDLRIEVGTGHVLDREHSWSTWWRSRVVPFVSEDRVTEEGRSRRGVNEVELLAALQGLTLREGDRFTVQAGRPAWAGDDSHRSSIAFVAAGWRVVDDERVFVLEGKHRWAGDYLVHLRPDLPVPVLVERVRVYGDGSTAVSTQRLLSFTAGSGPELHDAAYVPPAWRSELPGVPRAPLTRDGPAEAFSTRLPLPEAVALARADPRVALWLAEHPDAFVLNGELHEPLGGDAATWRVYFGDPGALERLEATVEAGGLLPPRVAQVGPGSGWFGMGPTLAEAESARPQACAEAAEAVALRTLGLDAVPEGAGRVARFDTYRDGGPSVSCAVRVEVAREPAAPNETRTSWARAELSGRTGAATSTLRIDTTTTRTTDVWLVPLV